MSDAVGDRLAEVIRQVLDAPGLEVHDSLTAADVEGWDSIAQVELVFAIEEAFGITFAADEMAEFADVGELRRHVLALVES